MQATSAHYADEQSRRIALTPILSDVLDGTIQVIENNDRTKADGTLEGSRDGKLFLLLLKEDKNEFGDGGSDPSTQAGLSAARTWVQANVRDFYFLFIWNAHSSTLVYKVSKRLRVPYISIANAGPWFAVLGFVFLDRVIVQRLTDFIWVGIDSALSRSHVNRVARIFFALRTSLERLKSYYMNLKLDSAHTRYFPSITTYRGEDGLEVEFEYLGYLEAGSDCVTLRAKTKNPAREIVVKFVERYSERAHRLLAEKGLAPRLLHFGPLELYGSLSMVVMEYIRGETFTLAKSKMNNDTVETVKSEIKCALTVLHENGLVFGDLRPPNVMITEAKKTVQVKLIDFDWAGEVGQVEYPHLLSPLVTWPKSARPLSSILIEHDLEMLERL
jgi:serine/threonine protein kinase